MALTFNLNFEKRTGNASKGQLLMEVVNDPSVDEAYPILVSVQVVGPSGETIKAYPSDDAPDFSITSGETEEKAIVPIEKDGLTNNDLPGTYVVSVKKKNTGDSVFTEVVTDAEIDYNPINSALQPLIATLEASVNCLTKIVTVNDTTSYTGYTVSDYELKLTPPTIPGVSLSTITSSTVTLQGALQYTNVSYQASLTATVNKTIYGEDGDTILAEYNDTVEAAKSIPITCPADICDFMSCAQSALAALELRACSFGGLNKLSLQDQANYMKIMHNTMMLLTGQGCGNSTMVNTAIANLEALVDCDCGCTENDSPKAIGGAEGADITAWVSISNTSYANSWVNGSNTVRYRRMGNFLALTGSLKRTAVTGASSTSLFGSTNPIADTSGLIIEYGYRIPITDLTTGLQVGYITRGSGSAWTVVTFADFDGGNNNFVDSVIPLSL